MLIIRVGRELADAMEPEFELKWLSMKMAIQENKVRPFYMRTIGHYGDELEKMMFASIKDASKWSGVSQNVLRNACTKNNNYVIRRSDKQKFWLLWGEYCLKHSHLEYYGYIKNGVSELTPVEEDRRFSKAVTSSGGLEEYKHATLRNLHKSARESVETQEVKRFRNPEDYRDPCSLIAKLLITLNDNVYREY